MSERDSNVSRRSRSQLVVYLSSSERELLERMRVRFFRSRSETMTFALHLYAELVGLEPVANLRLLGKERAARAFTSIPSSDAGDDDGELPGQLRILDLPARK